MRNSEIELVERVKHSRDMAAFRDLVLAHQKRLYHLIRKIAGNHEDSEDLLQETFIKALKHIGQLKDNARFGYWLNSIAVNLALAHKRKKYVKDSVSLENDLPLESLPLGSLSTQQAGEQPANAVLAHEIRTSVGRALLKLTEKNRLAFVLFHLEGMTVKEVAVTMDCPEVTVRTYVFRAVKSLRNQLKDYYKLFKE
ncbi:MAG TPA: RNA polymerase sigma factor [archaeon]|nr:RNA polymerase sigma factor [archaeon]